MRGHRRMVWFRFFFSFESLTLKDLISNANCFLLNAIFFQFNFIVSSIASITSNESYPSNRNSSNSKWIKFIYFQFYLPKMIFFWIWINFDFVKKKFRIFMWKEQKKRDSSNSHVQHIEDIFQFSSLLSFFFFLLFATMILTYVIWLW